MWGGYNNTEPREQKEQVVKEFKVEQNDLSPRVRGSDEFLNGTLDLGEEAYDQDEGVGAYFAYGFGLLVDEKIDYTIDGITYAIDGISTALGAAASALSCGYTAEQEDMRRSGIHPDIQNSRIYE